MRDNSTLPADVVWISSCTEINSLDITLVQYFNGIKES